MDISSSRLIVSVLIFVAFAAPVRGASDEIGHCIWYGECGKNEGGLAQPCSYNGTAKLLNETKSLDYIRDLCPQLINDKGEAWTCCAPDQVHTFAASMTLPRQLLGRCPSCYSNFREMFCASTCDPHQSKFVSVEGTKPYGPNKLQVVKIGYQLTYKYADGLFASCKDVQLPSNNQRALGVMCGTTADRCDIGTWLAYIGSKTNPAAPIEIVFTRVPYFPNKTRAMNSPITPCDSAPDNNSYACSCQDCKSMCGPPAPPITPSPPWEILHIDAMLFIMLLVLGGLLFFFGSIFIVHQIYFRNSLGLEDNQMHIEALNKTKDPLLENQVFESDISCMERLGAKCDRMLARSFACWGRFCARHPVIVLFTGLVVCAVLGCGLFMYDITTDPVELWSAKSSQARQEKDYFDNHFGPFFRIEQIIITVKNGTFWEHDNHATYHPGVTVFGPIFKKSMLHQILTLQNKVTSMNVTDGDDVITLKDICYAPLCKNNEADHVDNCTVESIVQYFQNNHTMIDDAERDEFQLITLDYIDHLQQCLQDPSVYEDTTDFHARCMSAFGGPTLPWVALGGYSGDQYGNATAAIITLIVTNHRNQSQNRNALLWEKAYVQFMKDFIKDNVNPNLTISFSSERSIEDEIERESQSDIATIVLSYMIMFIYISIALGHIKRCDYRIFIDSKISLGLCGVLIVLLSVVASLGTYSYFGVKLTLIIMEVVPFLVLAVGVDNIFILVQAYQRDTRRKNETRETQIGRILGKVGPSMLLTSTSETMAFFLGALTTMPAVKVFSLYAALAVLIDFLLQITCFVSLLALDSRRQEAGRYDVACCIPPKKKESIPKGEGQLYTLIKKYYAPFLMNDGIRAIVVFVFLTTLCGSIAVVNKIEIGLDQKLAMPEDSFVLDYFNNISTYLSVGPPVYFVVQNGHNYTTLTGQNQVCGANGCNQDSVLGQIYLASQQSNATKIAHTASSWIDDYFDWLQSKGDRQCCRVFASNQTFCNSSVDSESCTPCQVNVTDGRPSTEDFLFYLPWYLTDVPGTVCAKGGKAAYFSAVDLNGENPQETINNTTKIGATYFMTYHTILKTNADYIEAVRYAREIGVNVTRTIFPNDTGKHMVRNSDKETDASNYRVYPYSVFYVFYEQYLDIVHVTIMQLGISVTVVFVISVVLLGVDIYSGLIVLILIVMILTHMFGLMYLWDISLNAISLVNMIMCVGISVEFCSHIVRAFAVSIKPSKTERAKDALITMGSSANTLNASQIVGSSPAGSMYMMPSMNAD